MTTVVVRSRRVVTPTGTRPASVHINDGRISAVTDFNVLASGSEIIEAGDSAVMPGVVDTHVHINEPGRTDWEGFHTATQAAAAGGVTTLIEMPLNSIPATTTVSAFQEKVCAARGHLFVDAGFWAGVVPGNQQELRGLHEAGAHGFKCFLVPSGVDEFRNVTEADFRVAMPILAELGAPLLVHAELPGPIDRAAPAPKESRPNKYSTWLTSRPRAAENEAIAMLIRLAREFGVRTHIVHLSSSDALPILRAAKSDHVPITVETCPHYLTFAAEEIPDGATSIKCAPPIRERENRDALWIALHSGLIDLVASDHSPCPPHMKCADTGDFMRAWGGISSLQLSLPIMWTGIRRRGATLEQLCEWMCRAPARLAGLSQCKGTLEPGLDADIVIWNPDARFQVEPHKLFHRHKVTPYSGMTLFGVVETTIVRGNVVYDRGIICGAPIGDVLLRGRN
ncbi:MAG: allantoinase AllB [Candidatus Acidiferrales bacterium]